MRERFPLAACVLLFATARDRTDALSSTPPARNGSGQLAGIYSMLEKQWLLSMGKANSGELLVEDRIAGYAAGPLRQVAYRLAVIEWALQADDSLPQCARPGCGNWLEG